MKITRLVSELDGRDAKRLRLGKDSSKSTFVDMFADGDIFYTPKLITKSYDRLHRPSTPHPNFHPNPNFNSDAIPGELLLMEIFPRLADPATAIRCSVVCKRWNSLLTAPEFLSSFARLHRQSSYTMFLVFTFRSDGRRAIQHLCPSTLTVTDGSSITVGSVSDYNFTMHDLPLMVESACDDFLLLSRISTDAKWDRIRHLYVHNPITGRWLTLPQPPVIDHCGFSAIVSHRDSAPSRYSFRVVYITSSDIGIWAEFHVTVFSSETGQWSAPSLARKLPKKLHPVACNGLLYWVDYAANWRDATNRRVVILDAFTESWKFVNFPADLFLPPSFDLPLGVQFGPHFPPLGYDNYLPSMGVVRGKVRLAQMLRARGVFFLKFWELSCDDSVWGPVSEVRIKHPPLKDTEWVYFLSFHPEDSDIVFLCRDFDVCGYRLSTGKYTRVFTLSCPKGDEDPSFRHWLPLFAQALPVRLPLWPTPMPALPSSQV